MKKYDENLVKAVLAAQNWRVNVMGLTPFTEADAIEWLDEAVENGREPNEAVSQLLNRAQGSILRFMGVGITKAGKPRVGELIELLANHFNDLNDDEREILTKAVFELADEVAQ